MKTIEDLKHRCYVCPISNCWLYGGRTCVNKQTVFRVVINDVAMKVARASLILRGSKPYGQKKYATVTCGTPTCVNHTKWVSKSAYMKNKNPRSALSRLKGSKTKQIQLVEKIGIENAIYYADSKASAYSIAIKLKIHHSTATLLKMGYYNDAVARILKRTENV